MYSLWVLLCCSLFIFLPLFEFDFVLAYSLYTLKKFRTFHSNFNNYFKVQMSNKNALYTILNGSKLANINKSTVFSTLPTLTNTSDLLNNCMMFELTIKKSKFKAFASYARDFNESMQFLESIKDPKATHNCWAFRSPCNDRYAFLNLIYIILNISPILFFFNLLIKML